MKENKELIEKMREAVKSCFMLASYVMIEKITNEACQVATTHFADKWVKVGESPIPYGNHIECYYVKDGKVYEGHYCFESSVFWFYDGKGSFCHQSEISHYKIKKLPEPPQE